jgi:sulfide:quinone oxidoreductase
VQKVLIIGAGDGGAVLANSLNKQKYDITVLDRNTLHYYQPWFLYLAFKGANRKISREIRRILKPHIKFYQENVKKVDLVSKVVATESKKKFTYDYLVIATGTVTNVNLIHGLDKINKEFGDYHTNIEQAKKVWDHIQNFKGGTIVLGQSAPKCKCPSSILEGVFQLEEYLKKKRLKDKSKLVFFTPFPRAYSAEVINKIVEPMAKDRNIEVVTFFDVDSIVPENKVIRSKSGNTLNYDLPIVVPPCTGVDIEYNPATILTDDKFIKVDKYTMKVEGFDNVYAIGDANDLPTSKTGVSAHLEAKVVADILDGRDSKYSGRINCPFDTGYGKGTFVVADYDFTYPMPSYPVTRLKHFMKMMMSRMYWYTLRGNLDFVFEFHFNYTPLEKLLKKYKE